ncbi:hypothetical protein HXX76_005605 [Chlamydomonas incerta]|uniref:Uncharacterized protein n=1 Tax=Chlamydomonas incerta TaxID=51695 RepID=A0A835TGS6_CHLIN|nr:hypothetical protein HXX76_005605 [Chlamydomonas incerta]|eukprot:KAG2437991.1 hypothetical protein HXX76_005605 [Chlamydomonas incerta]
MGCGASVQTPAQVEAAPKPAGHANPGPGESPPPGGGSAGDAPVTGRTAPAATVASGAPADQSAVTDAALVAAERTAAAAERAAVAANAALGAASSAPTSKDADAGAGGANGGAGLLGQGLVGDLASFAAEALSSTCADLADALQHVPYAGAVFATVRVFFARAQQVRQNQRLFFVLAMQVRSASECLVSAYRTAGRAVDVCPQRVMAELQQAVQAASDLMLDFTDRSWFVRLVIAPRIAEDAEHVHKLLTVAQQNLDSACMQYLVRQTAGATAAPAKPQQQLLQPQQEAFAAAQADMAALVLQLQQLLAAAGAAGLALPGLPAAPATAAAAPPPPGSAAAASSAAADAGDAGGSGWGSELEADGDESEVQAACKQRDKLEAGPRRRTAADNQPTQAEVDDLSGRFATGVDLSRPYSAASDASQGADGALPLLAGLQAMLAKRGPKVKQGTAAAAAPPPLAPALCDYTPHSSNGGGGGGRGGGSGGGGGISSNNPGGGGGMDTDSLLQQLQALTGLDAEEVAEVTADAIELIECRQDAAAEAAKAGQELPGGGAALLPLRRKQQQGKGRFNLVQPPQSTEEPAPAKCMAWVPRRRDKDKHGNINLVPAHPCGVAKPKYRIQVDEFAGHFYVCGNHKTLFDAYQHTVEQL